MAPQYPQGTIAIVYPTWKAKSGDLVIAWLHDGTVLFKRLHVDGDHYTFISLNPAYPPVTVEKAKIAEVLPVGGTYQEQLSEPRPVAFILGGRDYGRYGILWLIHIIVTKQWSNS